MTAYLDYDRAGNDNPPEFFMGFVSETDYAVADAPVTEHFIAFTVGGESVVRLHHDGRVVVNPKWSTDEAARLFWQAVEALAPASA